jgi:hypothetical protein
MEINMSKLIMGIWKIGCSDEIYLEEYDKAEDKCEYVVSFFNETFRFIESQGVTVNNIDVSPKVFNTLKEIGEEFIDIYKTDIDGVYGTLWTADIRVIETQHTIDGKIIVEHNPYQNKYKIKN